MPVKTINKNEHYINSVIATNYEPGIETYVSHKSSSNSELSPWLSQKNQLQKVQEFVVLCHFKKKMML